MKNAQLNAALRSVDSTHSFKVTLNADAGDMSHTEVVETPSGVRGMLRKYPALATGRIIVKAIAKDNYFTKTVIFDGKLA